MLLYLCYVLFLFFMLLSFLYAQSTHIYKLYFLLIKMNIIRMRQDERKRRIARMQFSIKKSKDPDFEKLVMMCCIEWGVAGRTAREYLKIALWNIENEKREARKAQNNTSTN